MATLEVHSRGRGKGFDIPGLKDYAMRHIDRTIRSFFLAAAIVAAIAAAIVTPTAIMAGPMPQGSSVQIVLAQERVAPAMTIERTVSMPVSLPLLAASFRPYADAGKSPAQFIHVFAGPNEPDQSMAQLLPMEQVRTVFFTQSSLPLAQAWSGRLQLDAFQNTFRIQNVQLFPGGPRSVHLSGLSVSFHFGRDAQPGHPIHAWRSLSRIVGTVLN